MATGENVLFLVEKRKISAKEDNGRVVRRILFRTRESARAYRNMMNKHMQEKGYSYFYEAPTRVQWGPDNV